MLMVDDDADIRRIGQLSLVKVGRWDVELAASGTEAIAMAASAKPDLILLDVMMPGLDGPSTLSQLKSDPQTAGIPVIFMTAKVLSQEVEQYMSMGASGVIAKPFDPMKLPEEIRRILQST